MWAWCLYGMIHGIKMMSLVWILIWDMSEGWLMNMAWCRYEIHFYFRGLGMMNERDSTWDTNEDGIAKVGMGYIHMNVKYYLFWLWLVHGQCVIPWNP